MVEASLRWIGLQSVSLGPIYDRLGWEGGGDNNVCDSISQSILFFPLFYFGFGK